MMRLLWTTICFGAGALATLAAAYAASEMVAPVHPRTAAVLGRFEARSQHVTLLSVGNSHGVAVDFAALGVPGAHLYQSGQDLFEATYLARYAAPRAPRLNCVLMTMSYGWERLDNAVLRSGDYTGIRRGLYLRAGGVRFIPGDHGLWLTSLAAPIARPDHWSEVALRLAGRPSAPPRLAADGKPVQDSVAPRSDRVMVVHARRRVRIHLTRFAESVSFSPSTPRRAAAELEALARDLGRRGQRLVLYTSPLHQAYLDRLPPELREETRLALAPVLRQGNVLWLDFGAHPGFGRRNDLFRDSDHMNDAGARAFSALLRDTLATRAPSCLGAGG